MKIVSVNKLNILFLRKSLFYAFYFFLIECLLVFGHKWFKNPDCVVDPYRLECTPDRLFLNLDSCTNLLFACDHPDLFPELSCVETCAQLRQDKESCLARQAFQNLMYFFLLAFNILSGVYLYMADFDMVKNNMSRARILSTVSKMVSCRKGKKHKKKHKEEEGGEVQIELEGLVDEKEEEEKTIVEEEEMGEFEGEEQEDEDGEGEGGEKVNLLSKKHFLQKVHQFNKENFCAWDYEDLCFLTTTVFLNFIIIIYTINTFATKPPYCSGGGLPSSLDYTLFSIGILFVCVLLGAWGAWKYKIKNLDAKWNNRKTESKVLTLLRTLRDVMVGGAVVYVVVDISFFFLHSIGLY